MPEDVRQWFLSQVAKLWPVSSGSLSLRRNSCIRERCSACESGEGHPSYALYIRKKRGRTVIYVPDDLSDTVAEAVSNGQKLEELMIEAGERYLKALKAERKKP